MEKNQGPKWLASEFQETYLHPHIQCTENNHIRMKRGRHYHFLRFGSEPQLSDMTRKSGLR